MTEQGYRPLQAARAYLDEARAEIAAFEVQHGDDERILPVMGSIDLLVSTLEDIERLALDPPELRVLRPRE